MSGRRPEIGDVYELATRMGFGYIQYTHGGDHFGDLVRILPGVYSDRPQNLTELSTQKELYYVFTGLSHAVRKKQIRFVANRPVPEWALRFPTMRKASGRDRSGRVVGWYIGHGLKLNTVAGMQHAFHVKELTPEQKRLSLVQIWPVSLIAENIERAWLPERAEELGEQERVTAEKQGSGWKAQDPREQSLIVHFLYFPKEETAREASEDLRLRGWIVEIRLGADGENWLLLAKQEPSADDCETMRQELELVAHKFGGEYDGWGATVTPNRKTTLH
jgi:regulator of ribonuclease activity B